MLASKLEKAIAEAEKFIEMAKKMERDPVLFDKVVTGTRKSGQLKRQSMVLSEALIELRKPSNNV